MAQSHLQWPHVHIGDGEEERSARASTLYLNHSREASGIGSCGLCLSSAPVVNQLGDQRRRWGKCHKALPHTSAWAATSSSLSDSRPEGDKTPGPAPQETSWSKGDNHSTCQGLIWTTRTQTFGGIYEGWHTAGKEPPNNAYLMCWEDPLRNPSVSSALTPTEKLLWNQFNDWLACSSSTRGRSYFNICSIIRRWREFTFEFKRASVMQRGDNKTAVCSWFESKSDTFIYKKHERWLPHDKEVKRSLFRSVLTSVAI